MKIRRLDLIAYGPFSNEVLDFETDNLHLIYGPNEAGKSTALRALQAVLYGMTDKRDAFLHPWELMRVGMSVDTGNGIIRVERRKGKGVRSLVYAGTDRAVTAEEWSRVVPVLDQNLFIQMFGLDYQRLVGGGRELAEGKGDIGQALLAAAGDLGNSVDRLHAFQSRSIELFQPHARSQSKLSVALRQYKDAEKRIRSERFSSHAYRAAVLELEDKEREMERVGEEIRTCAAQHAALTRLQQAAPGVALLLEKERDLTAMSGVTLLAADFASRYQDAVKLLAKALTTAENSQAELDRLTQKLAATPREPALAALKIEIEMLFGRSGKIDAGREDTPKREAELRLLRERTSRNLYELGLDVDPANCVELRVKILQRSNIDHLADEHRRLTTLLGEAGANLDKLRNDVQENLLALADFPTCPDTAELERCLAGLAAMPTEKEVAKLRAQVVATEERAATDLKAFPLFGGTREQLQELQTPLPATVRAYQTRYAQQDATERQVETDESATRAEIVSLEQKLQRMENRWAVPTDSDLENSRARRELGWTAVKRRWISGAPDAAAEAGFLSGSSSGQLDTEYEGAVQQADDIADHLRDEAASVEKKVLFLDQIANGKERLREIAKAKDQGVGNRRELDVQWRSLWAPASIQPLTPAEMLDWLDRRRDLVNAMHDAASLRHDLTETEARLDSWQEELTGILETLKAPATGSMYELIQTARRIVEEAKAARLRKRDLEKERRRLDSELVKAEKRRAEFQGATRNWDTQWASAIEGLPVPAGVKPDAVKEVVRLLDEIARDSEEINGLVHRIETMRQDDEEFSAAVSKITALTNFAPGSTDALIVIKKLNQAATTAKQNEDAATAIRQDIDRARELIDRVELQADSQRKALVSLCAEAGIADPDSLGIAIENSAKRRELISQIADQRKALAAACAGRTIEELVEAVNALNMDALPAQLKELEDRQQEHDRRKQECSTRVNDLEHEFQLHESAVGLSQAAAEKQEAAARILELSEQFLEQEIAARLLSAAIERYRRRHQDPLLERAGQYLERLTCGSFAELSVDFEEGNRRVLRAVRKDTDEHVDVTGMSDGARDQLFFALRVAYIEDHCARFGSSPVILDDVLMAFDNDRATAALQVLNELAKKTQVLVFTHHAHHIDLAQAALGETAVTIHDLASVPVAS